MNSSSMRSHWPAAILLAALSTAAARAQYSAQGDGRMFDANPQVGGSRYYAPARPQTPMLLGNLTASGYVRGGLSLRSYSPIPGRFDFRGNLGSAGGSDFLRDSISVADALTPTRTLTQPQPFFDPVRTTPEAGFLRGQYAPQVRAPAIPSRGGDVYQPLPGLLNYGSPNDPRTNIGLSGPSRAISPVEQARSLSSTIFAPDRAVRPTGLPGSDGVPGMLPGEVRTAPGVLSPGQLARANRLNDPTRPIDPRDPRDANNTPLPGAGPLSRPIDDVLGGDRNRLLAGPSVATANPALGVNPLTPSFNRATIRDRAPLTPMPTTPGAALATGQDLFTDMQLAVALERDPAAQWFSQMQQGLRSQASATGQQQALANASAEEFITRVMSTPVRSFAGEGQDPFNQELRKAEGLLASRQFVAAAGGFERAYRLDPTNPLAMIGRGHALLAAGDYLSSAVWLIRGLERFPELARFSLNLETMMGGGEIIDVRRADLMKRLADREDSRLRFLLGYLEYHGGQRASGQANLEKAAAGEQPGSLIHRYPEMLKGAALPPPALHLDQPAPAAPSPAPAKPDAADAGAKP